MTRSLLALLLFSGACVADEVHPPAARDLTLAEALRLADEYNPRLRAAGATVDGARAGITSARSYINPSLTFGSFGRQQPTRIEGVPGMMHGLTITQPVETPAVRQTRIDAAEFRREATQFSLTEVRLAVRGAVKQAFYDVLRRRAELDLAKGNLELLEDLRRRIEVQVNVGEAARLELTRAEAEVNSARIQVRSAELRTSVALLALQSAIGAPIGNVNPRAPLDSPAVMPPLDTLRQDVLARHPTLAVANAEVRRAEATVANEKAQRRPQPTFWLDWLQQPESAQVRFGVTVPVPIWNKRQGQIAEAVAQQRVASAVEQQRRIELVAALERAYSLYEVASQQVQIFETGTLRQAEAAVNAAQAAFKFGERGIIEVLDAQRVLRAARMDFLNAQFDRQQALIELEQLRAVDLGDTP